MSNERKYKLVEVGNVFTWNGYGSEYLVDVRYTENGNSRELRFNVEMFRCILYSNRIIHYPLYFYNEILRAVRAQLLNEDAIFLQPNHNSVRYHTREDMIIPRPTGWIERKLNIINDYFGIDDE